MELIDRYLQAVGFWLPRKQKEDILAELSEDLHSQVEEQEAKLGRKLAEPEIECLLKMRGRPVLVANRYLPQQYLIGPLLFPIYRFVLMIVGLCYLVPWIVVALVLIASGAAVLQHQRDLALPRHEIERGAQAVLVLVGHLDHSEQPAVGLAGGQSVGVRVIPVEAGAVAKSKVVAVGRARRREHRAATVVARVDRQPVPVHDRGIGERVDEIDPDALSSPQHQRRIDEVAAVDARKVGLRQSSRKRRAGGNPSRPKRQRALVQGQPAKKAPIARNQQRSRRVGAAGQGRRRGRGDGVICARPRVERCDRRGAQASNESSAG